VLTNHDLEKMVETSDEWIFQRTGVRERRIVSPGESTSTLAAAAAKQALQRAGLEARELDLIICATVSGDLPFPAAACFVQAELGAKDVPCFDISAACSGFLYALTVATQFIENGMYRRVLVIGADCLSIFTDYTDRGSCILFGDGAGAAVLEAAENTDRGVLYNILKADGSGWDYIHVPAGGSRMPTSVETVNQRQHYIKMRGREVYKFAVEKMQWLLANCMEACSLSVDDVTMVVPHQVNSRIIASATEKLNFPAEKVYTNIDHMGNTSAASIPLALNEAMLAGRIGPGATVLMVAFGAGLTWAGSVIKL
jgi:3-oxoacyl-[acyl-carrier-protein] synthase-3